MSAVKAFYQLTMELIQLLEASQEDRDEKITHVESLLEKREELMQKISPPYTKEEQDIGKKLLGLNQKVNQLLQSEKVLIQKDIKEVKIKKDSNTKYVNPYQSLTTDGMFYDKRK